ncbi:flagellar export chaperone FliS [Aromatoleum toluvorans]|uniref:Flagellar secretion chaperone FliS n=1 Tax=Aromatoleum toluvorans TaxID=92002 RepID=A0ABX1Q4Q3_9RHOO|nr:flagellar export chaperone FliS [Aromatoleum toluvorans]NMG45885.1 flagellar export chaperone FliS [Aromatoleum toluvorans]
MFGSSSNRASAYAKVGVETGVSTADPHKLILMLFDGAILSIATAAAAMERNDISTKGQAISKTIEIVINGLKASLDLNAGGELASRLSALYDYMTERLLYANLHNSRPALDEVRGLLETLREAWAGIAPGATAANVAA